MDSLTRHAASQVGFGDERTKGFDVLVGEGESTVYTEPMVEDVTRLPHRVGRGFGFGRVLIVLMGVGGLIIVWLYSAQRSMLQLSSLNALIQRAGIQSIFANPADIGIMSLAALLIAYWVAHRRKVSQVNLSLSSGSA